MIFPATKNIQLIALALLLGILGLPAYAGSENHLAQSEELEILRAEAIEKTSAVSGTQNSSEEIVSRKEALQKIFTFSSEEIRELLIKDRLLEIAKGTDNYADYAKILIKNLTGYQEYIGNLTKNLENEKLTLEEVKKIAADFKEWRMADYDRDIRSTIDLLLFDRGQRALQITKNRFEKIHTDVLKLEVLAQAEKGLFTEAIAKVEASLEKVTALQEAARTQFEKQIPKTAEEKSTEEVESVQDIEEESALVEKDALEKPAAMASLKITEETTETMEGTEAPALIAPIEADVIEIIKEPTVSELVQDAITVIKEEIYQDFFAMSKLARALLK